jgi:hypothetical protein
MAGAARPYTALRLMGSPSQICNLNGNCRSVLGRDGGRSTPLYSLAVDAKPFANMQFMRLTVGWALPTRVVRLTLVSVKVGEDQRPAGLAC